MRIYAPTILRYVIIRAPFSFKHNLPHRIAHIRFPDSLYYESVCVSMPTHKTTHMSEITFVKRKLTVRQMCYANDDCDTYAKRRYDKCVNVKYNRFVYAHIWNGEQSA